MESGISHKHRRYEPTLLNPGEKIGEGDTYLVEELLPPDLADVAFKRVRDEVQWHKMIHRGGEVPRLVAHEGLVSEDGSYPIYRHPADDPPPLLPFSPTVAHIREYVEKSVKHPVNHVLIQHYRSGADYISEHSDKTIDIVRGSNIINVSLGAQRIMTLRTKKDVSDGEGRTVQHVPLPHNSMFVMGLDTNMRWLHGVRTDKRQPKTKTDAERYENEERISLTFRHIGTFLSADGALIWGQGARGKTREDAQPVVRGGPESEQLLIAFGEENHSSSFDWESAYGRGFDVLNFNAD
ncbi:uncharacterized protein LAESUDRAFT_745230 [Laetiporus sulphureus 93-53]|uniref:Fe2OG dioxygenase domain-containing protein n=1 Tax=Laetiporus sulphureus 93-53 TaxID=1314785 RepID=A0A165C0U9_9APHY|nr:uncharacterized protein LAESUDRAFT_745230 [Laetiporus sulphureus 93-53]KZT01997.1 hypothetical protein LAESUDRAFT_745230 [Laetiporus sulphureus 93-53]